MKKYLDKNFFDFLAAFLLVLLASFSILVAAGFYQENKNEVKSDFLKASSSTSTPSSENRD